MKQVLAILGDSFRESVDRRALFVLLGLALLPILFCFSLGFETEPLEEVVAEQAEELTLFEWSSVGTHVSERMETQIDVGDVRPVEDDSFGPGLRGGYAVRLSFASRAELDHLAAEWFRFHRHPDFVGEESAGYPDSVDGEPLVEAFLDARFAAFGWEHVAVREVEPATWDVAVRAEYPHEVAGAFTVTFGFGAGRLPVEGVTLAEFVLGLQQGLIQTFVGFIGMLIALSACGSFVPNMLQKGTLDLVLARPISRTKLLLAKYLGGLWFVFCLATFTVVGCWLGLSIGSGYSNPWFLVSIVTLIASFAVLYAVAVLAGVATRSSGVSILIALVVWFVSSTVVSARHAIRGPLAAHVPPWVDSVVEGAYAVLPKVKDLDYVSMFALSQSHMSEGARARHFGVLPDIDWAFSIGTTAAFTAAVLAAAVWLFRRRDY